ncbi:MAG: class I SAM-dependent methyltransferase [Candidatus Omnitrophota bacterium]
MSGFYQALADHYDELFPLNRGALAFVLSFLNPPNASERGSGLRILDIGSATGQFPLALAQIHSAFQVTGIEPEPKMLAMAQQRVDASGLSNLRMLRAGMRDIDTFFPPESLDAILCLGNTLVHLPTRNDIRQFIHAVTRVLKKNGIFILQIVNYSRVSSLLAGETWELPRIDRPRVSLIREYQRPVANGERETISFTTRLTVKATAEVIENETLLYPLVFEQIDAMVKDAGLVPVRTCGNYEGEPWTPQSPALIMAVKRPMD